MIKRSCQGKQSERTGKDQGISHSKCNSDSSFYNLRKAEGLRSHRDGSKYSGLSLGQLPDLIAVELAAKVIGISVKTLYDWKYRGKMRKKKIPPELFAKIGGSLYLRKDTLVDWVFGRNFS